MFIIICISSRISTAFDTIEVQVLMSHGALSWETSDCLDHFGIPSSRLDHSVDSTGLDNVTIWETDKAFVGCGKLPQEYS